MLPVREKSESSGFVFANGEGKPYVGTSVNHLHRDAVAPKVKGKRRPLFPGDFVLHSLRHTMLIRLGSREWMLSQSCGLRVRAASWFRSATSIQPLRQSSTHSSGFNCRAISLQSGLKDCHPLQYPLHSRGQRL